MKLIVAEAKLSPEQVQAVVEAFCSVLYREARGGAPEWTTPRRQVVELAVHKAVAGPIPLNAREQVVTRCLVTLGVLQTQLDVEVSEFGMRELREYLEEAFNL